MTTLTLEVTLAGLADAMRDKIMPALAHDPFAAEQARLAVAVLAMAASQVDGLAAIRAAENEAMRALFGDAAGLVGEAFGKELAGAAKGAEPGLRIAELDRENDRLRRLLVELHAALEDGGTAEAAAMHQRIWCLLRDMEHARP